MLTALINGNRSRPIPGAVGQCPFCASEMISRCGEVRVHHWAHKTKIDCDPWWEPETDWHRNWKNEFPLRWQEHVFTDQNTGEKHIADVYTLARLTLEIQHSRLDPSERRAREDFYKNMLWVVDGSRLKGDRQKILGWRKALMEINNGQEKTGLCLLKDADELFPSDWLQSTVPVCFDYLGPNAETESVPTPLFVLYPGTVHGGRLVEPLTRDALLRAIYSERVHMPAVRGVLQNVSRLKFTRKRG